MKVLVVFLFFLISGCPVNKIKVKKSTSNVEHEAAYEIPPHAPIPPEKYCYELHKDRDITKLELTVTLDSVLGKLEHFPKRQDEADGIFIGTIYENTLLVSYQYTVDGKSRMEDQEWKISGDSIYRKITETIKQDSTSRTGAKDSDRVVYTPALHKAPCI